MARVQLDHSVISEVDVDVAGQQGPVDVAGRDVALALSVQDVQAQAERPEAVADVGLLSENPVGIEAADKARQGKVRGALELIIEHAGRRLRTVERAGQAVQHLDASEALAGHGCGADDVEAVEPGVLHDAALEAAGLRPRHFEALLVADLDGGQVAQGVVHRPRLQVDDQVLRHGGHGDWRVEDRPDAKRSQIRVLDCVHGLVGGPFPVDHDPAELAWRRPALGGGRSRCAERQEGGGYACDEGAPRLGQT